MTRNTKLICLAFEALFAASVLCVFCIRGTFTSLNPIIPALAVAAVPALGYLMSRRHTLLAYSFSLIPALPLMAYFLTGACAWAITAAVLFVIYLASYNLRPAILPEPPRFTTQKWVSSLIYAEIMLLTTMLMIIKP